MCPQIDSLADDLPPRYSIFCNSGNSSLEVHNATILDSFLKRCHSCCCCHPPKLNKEQKSISFVNISLTFPSSFCLPTISFTHTKQRQPMTHSIPSQVDIIYKTLWLLLLQLLLYLIQSVSNTVCLVSYVTSSSSSSFLWRLLPCPHHLPCILPIIMYRTMAIQP